MNFNINPPPPQKGSRDIPRIFDWCNTLRTELQRILRNIDDSNITSMSAAKLIGQIRPSAIGGIISYDGNNLTITGGTITIQNSDGTASIKIDETGTLKITGAVIE